MNIYLIIHFDSGWRSHSCLDEFVQAFFALADIVGAKIVQNAFAWKLGIEIRILFLDLEL